jgi:serine protease Do
MPLFRIGLPVLLLAFHLAPVFADQPMLEVEFTDDTERLDNFTRKLGELAKADKCIKPGELKKKAETNFTGKLEPAKPADKPLSPEELAVKLRESVFLIGSVIGDAQNGYEQGRMATAWVAADGVLITNGHVFDQIDDDEFYGAMNHKGEVFALTDLLAIDSLRDVAAVKIDAEKLTPLPIATKLAKVGSWVGVLGHPGDRYFTFTQGHVSRYSTFKEDDGKRTRWMSITADYAYGSSGSPVVDRFGNVMAMAALTESIDYPDDGGGNVKAVRKSMVRRTTKRLTDDDKKKEEKKGEAAVAAAAAGTPLQMVVKMTVPVSELLEVIRGQK